LTGALNASTCFTISLATGITAQAGAAHEKAVIGYRHITKGLKALTRKEIDAVIEERLIVEYCIAKRPLPI
jgi:hypothetical protein